MTDAQNTQSPNPPSPPVGAVSPTTGGLVTAETILADIHAIMPEAEMVLPLIPGVGAQALAVVKLADSLDVILAGALAAIAERNGTSPLEALNEFIAHNTRGARNSPALS